MAAVVSPMIFCAIAVAIALASQPEIPRHSPALGLDSHLEQLVRVEYVHSIGDEGEVVHTSIDHKLADQDPRRVPSENHCQQTGP